MSLPTTTYTNQNGSSVEVHRVDANSAGNTYSRPDGSGLEVREGDLLVQAGNPNFWDLTTADALSEYSTEGRDVVSGNVDSDKASEIEEYDDTADVFDPSEHRATEVKAYLADRADAGDRANFDRVTEAEQNGHNRKSAYSEW